MNDAPVSRALNRLWLPRLSLSACVRGVMGRDTRGVSLSDAQRLTHFPAAPLCSLSWWFTGSSERVDLARLQGPHCPMPGRFVLAGPHTVPTCSWCPGTVHALMLVLLPDALFHLLGLRPGELVNRMVDAAEVLPPEWLAMCEAVQAEPGDDDCRVRLIEDFLEPRWQAARPPKAFAGHRYHDWAQGLALRAATSAAGRSLRQVERRIQQWAGQSMRELRTMARAEQTFFDVQAAGEPDWAAIAAGGGYADQSHLCRETRRMTGFSPTELRQKIAEEEPFWAYRLWA